MHTTHFAPKASCDHPPTYSSHPYLAIKYIKSTRGTITNYKYKLRSHLHQKLKSENSKDGEEVKCFKLKLSHIVYIYYLIFHLCHVPAICNYF